MSANLDLVRSIYADWGRGDFSTSEWADPEIEYVWADGPEPGAWKGLTAMAEGFRHFFSAWQDLRNEAEDCREIDDERVLVLARFTGRGKTSGVELGHLGTKGAAVFDVRGGKVTRMAMYLDRNRALADLGLEE